MQTCISYESHMSQSPEYIYEILVTGQKTSTNLLITGFIEQADIFKS